jgi:opacity protein-like surface antigen
MKKYSILISLLLGAIMLNAGVGFDIGGYKPADSKLGTIWGVDLLKNIDERVDLNLSVNYFRKNYEGGTREYLKTPTSGSLILKDSDITTSYLPLMAGFRVAVGEHEFQPFVGGGLGFGLAWESVYNRVPASGTEGTESYEPPFTVDETKFYSGFTWQINTGVRYEIASSSQVYAKLFYNRAVMTRDRKSTDEGLLIKELNLSGVGLSIGIRVSY